MATSYVLLAGVALLVYILFSKLLALRKSIAMAEESGLPYFVVPFYTFSRPWLVLSKPVFVLIRKLPESLIPTWLKHVAREKPWTRLFSQFDHTDLKTYLVVSPGSILAWTANAEVINQITTRRSDFPKPIHIYKAVDLFGKNVVTTEGNAWRRHRKVTSPSFTEKNNHLVWNESINQAESMLKSWTGLDGGNSRTITTVTHDCMRLSLHVISRAGFGIHLRWPGVDTKNQGIYQGPKAGHTMTYTNALEGLIHNLLLVVGVPHRLLRILPFERTKKAYESFIEWNKYMNEMMEEKKVQVSHGKADDGLDLMGALVRSAGYGSQSKGDSDYLIDSEILGNAFVFMVAGHETTANTIHFALIFLAMEPAEQRKLQKDIDSIIQGKQASEWDYDKYLPRLFGGMTGAVLNETLRLIPPVVNIPKYTHDWQPITIDGKQYKFPPKVMLGLTAVSVHRNPRYWPTGPPVPRDEAWHQQSGLDNDLNEFRPSRWLLNERQKKSSGSMPSRDLKNTEAEDLGVNTAADTSDLLFKPVKGSYIPFSDGYRSCIGRRFAQVEVLVVLARIFSEYSVEFAVDKYASDAEVEAMSENERKETWKKARLDARETLRTRMGSIITIQLRSGSYVPLRFIRRGKERFASAD